MKKFKLVTLLLTFVLLIGLAACDDGQAPPAEPEDIATPADSSSDNKDRRDYRVTPKGGGEDIVTVMLYMCGSDLEEDNGAATSDLTEIFYSEISDQVNIIIETGGSREWKNPVIPADTNMRWRATTDGPEQLLDVGLRDMEDPATLTDFITYCEKEFPADRYMLIMWDHGGGTLNGFAVDRNFPNKPEDEYHMSIPDIDKALNDAGVIFDLIGFDACLMATAETAFVLDRYADFMVSSQRLEPGNGWYYTDWITALSNNTSIDTLELGTVIADTYIDHNADGYFGGSLTLSVVDLTYTEGLFESLYTYFDSAESVLIDDQKFAEMSQFRYDSRAIADDNDQVDIALLVNNMNYEASGEVASILEKCVAYNATTIADHSGLCLYFPYSDLYSVDKALSIFDAIGVSDDYKNFFKTFASLMAGGQAYNSGAEYDGDWVDEDIVNSYETYYEENSYTNVIEINEKSDYFALRLTDEEWELITSVELAVLMYTDDLMVDLGADNVYEFDDDGDLIVDFDYTWVSINGTLAPFYAIAEEEEGDKWISYGSSPCFINGQDAELVVAWDNNNPDGYVPGYRFLQQGGIMQKGLFELKDGDDIIFKYRVYNEDYEEINQYYSNEVYVSGKVIVSYEDLGDVDCEICYVLTDVYGNKHWTETLVYS